MPWPTEMLTFTKLVGAPMTMSNGKPLRRVVRVIPSASATWIATGDNLLALMDDVSDRVNSDNKIVLPDPTQGGFLGPDGQLISDWIYKVEFDYYDQDNVRQSNLSLSVNVGYTSGQPRISTLAGSIPLPTSAGVKVAVTVPTGAFLDGDDLVLIDLQGDEMFRENVRGPAGDLTSGITAVDNGDDTISFYGPPSGGSSSNQVGSASVGTATAA